jgi:HD-like signal output (HDOD) protein
MERRDDFPHDIPAPHFAPRFSLEEVQLLLRVINDDDVSFEQIARSLEPRGPIAALFTRTANSAGLGAGQPVRSVRHALSILGLQRIRQIVSQLLVAAAEERAAMNRSAAGR